MVQEVTGYSLLVGACKEVGVAEQPISLLKDWITELEEEYNFSIDTNKSEQALRIRVANYSGELWEDFFYAIEEDYLKKVMAIFQLAVSYETEDKEQFQMITFTVKK